MRILIVDDDSTIREVLSEALALQPGCEIETASSGLEALCRVLIGDIDLVITDWRMPGMNGLDLCRNIRKCDQGKYVYVVLITGHGDPESVIEGLNAGADEFLAKPVGPSELMARVWSIRRMKGFHDELQLRNRELKESQRFRNDWIDLVVNAIRSPVSTVLGFSELAASKASPRLQPHVEKVSREARWIDTMLKQMLVVARSGDGGLKPSRSQVNLQTLVTSTCRSLSAVADSKNVRLVAFCPQGEFIAEVDVPLIQGALENLLANAIRHSPQESTVVVELRQENNEILLAVVDQGPGMPAEAREKLFDPRSGARHDAKAQPCLGLAYCQTVTDAHEGRISCESNQPTGTRFEIRLPVSSTDGGELFDPVAFASTIPEDAILSLIAGDEQREDEDIDTAIDSRLVLVPGPDSPLPS